jgi:hypothetical protein
MVSAWRADTKDTLPADIIDVFCSSEGFLIFRQVEDTSIWRRETHDPASISEIEFPTIAAPHSLWLSTQHCPVEG